VLLPFLPISGVIGEKDKEMSVSARGIKKNASCIIRDRFGPESHGFSFEPSEDLPRTAVKAPLEMLP